MSGVEQELVPYIQCFALTLSRGKCTEEEAHTVPSIVHVTFQIKEELPLHSSAVALLAVLLFFISPSHTEHSHSMRRMYSFFPTRIHLLCPEMTFLFCFFFFFAPIKR